MVVLPDGSFIWLECNGKPMIEYAHQAEEDDKLNTHTTNVYVPAKKGEFQVWFNLGNPRQTSRLVKIDVDGQHAKSIIRKLPFGDKDIVCEGWQVSPTTTRRFTFADLNTSEECQLGSTEYNEQLLKGSCVQVNVVDIVLCANWRTQTMTFTQPHLAEAVHPLSDVSKHVGLQVKPGSATTRVTAGYKKRTKEYMFALMPHAKHYSVRFYYRSENYLVEKGIMPQSDIVYSEKESIAASIEAEIQTQGAKSEEELQRRLKEELLAIRQMSDSQMDMSVD